jgi:glutamate-1-semialdehyde aminotransferase
MEPTATPRPRRVSFLADAGKSLAGGGTGLFVLPPDLDLVVERGAGRHVRGDAGREPAGDDLDAWPVLLGHAHRALATAVQARIGNGTTDDFLNEPGIALAKRLVEAIARGEAVQDAGSGTEATGYALRFAPASTQRNNAFGYRGASALIERGRPANPNETFDIPIARTEADVDRTLDIADSAFAAPNKAR